MNGINLMPYEVKLILKEEAFTIVRPFRPQPHPSYSLAQVLSDGRAVFDEPYGYDVHYYSIPGIVPGEPVYIRERWATSGNYDHINPSDLSLIITIDDIRYYSTEKYQVFYTWRSAQIMPEHYSQLILITKTIRVFRIQDLGEKEALNLGVDKISISQVHRQAVLSNIDDLRQIWNKRYKNTRIVWENNPWVTLIDFEIKERKSK